MHAIDHASSQDEDNRELKSYRDRVRELERAAEQLNHDARLTMEYWKAERGEEQQEGVFPTEMAAASLACPSTGGGSACSAGAARAGS